ncbi:TlpA family protein disulfide reductase [Microbacterium gorillae]|uniref:TlpA family protein disulfide reductase n=1 Tax=Microbacterium gorillae TaxID=1231063 RepID=UPI000694A9A6|nr:TlpA disulfide reductase family protein [Microbacterium gorillae]
MNRLTRRALVAVTAAALAVGLAACTSTDEASEAFRNGQNSGYVAGDGTVKEFPAAERGAPVDFAGTDEEGRTVSGADLRGQVVVVNFWYAGCGPCRVEAKDLEKVYTENKGAGVTFVGVNTSDTADTAKSFMKQYDVTYPSLIDAGDGAAKIAFAQATPLQSTPTTLVLDKEGRVAARILGPIDGTSVLNTLVRELAEAS